MKISAHGGRGVKGCFHTGFNYKYKEPPFTPCRSSEIYGCSINRGLRTFYTVLPLRWQVYDGSSCWLPFILYSSGVQVTASGEITKQSLSPAEGSIYIFL